MGNFFLFWVPKIWKYLLVRIYSIQNEMSIKKKIQIKIDFHKYFFLQFDQIVIYKPKSEYM